MSYVLMTGATGLVGRYLMRDLLSANMRLAVVVRSTRKQTARQRVENAMADWEQSLGFALPRPVVLEGDITEPDLGLDARAMRWVAENCTRVLHNAASLTFISTGPTSEPWRSNVGGTQNMLDVCRQAGIRDFHHVSTAYVCGQRTGLIRETELELGQDFSNDYERSKVQSEKMVREADCLDKVTVYRPAIIVGDSQTGLTTTFHGFYAPLQAIATMVEQMGIRGPTGYVFSSARFSLDGFETKNLVPVDWVSAVMSHIFIHPELHCDTYHITPRHPATIKLMADVYEEASKFFPVDLVGAGCDFPNPTEYEQLFQQMISVYTSYWRDDPTFDTTNTRRACPHLPCPHVDRSMLMMLAKTAIDSDFEGPRAKPRELRFDAAEFVNPLIETQLGKARPTNSQQVNLQVRGQGGGQWRLYLENSQAIGADAGLNGEGTTVELESTTLEGLLRGEISPAEAQTHRLVRIEGDDLSPLQAATILCRLSPAMQPG